MQARPSSTGGHRGWLTMLAPVAAVGDVINLAVAVAGRVPSPPEPEPAHDPPVSAPLTTPTKSATPGNSAASPGQRAEEASRPLATGVDLDPRDRRGIAKILSIGKTPDGALAVPQPGPNLDNAAWYRRSPTPGQPGPSVIEGHVATEHSDPPVFYNLGDQRPGKQDRGDPR